MQTTNRFNLTRIPILAAGIASLLTVVSAVPTQAAVTYIGETIIPGNGTDLSGLNGTILEDGVSPNNGLNGFGSGLAYAGNGVFYGLADRGPNKVQYSGGSGVDYTTSYPNRYQKFSINLTPVGSPDVSGNYSSYTVGTTNVGTTLLTNSQGVQYLGISTAYSTNPAVENHRLDSEGIRVAPDGTVWVSDEYGPYILHFNANGQEIGSLALPAGFQPANPQPNAAVEAYPANTTGRTTNRGAEGLAITPDGKTLVAMMQSSLIQDGGLNGSNCRILVYDLTNPTAAPKQYLYYLDAKTTPISELLAINSHKFLIDERNSTGSANYPTAIKNLYQIDLNQSPAPTDLTTSAYPGTTSANGLGTTYQTTPPPDVTILQKTLFANISSILNTADQTIPGGIFSSANGLSGIPDKIEGYAWGPDLPDGRHLLLATNDNDFVQPGGTAGSGYPNYIWAFAVDPSDVPDFQPEMFNTEALNSINHIIVVYQENWSFDGLYGSFPGANGFANASSNSLTQIDRLNGNPLVSEAGTFNYNRISQSGNIPNLPLVQTSNANSNPGTLNTPPQPLGSATGTAASNPTIVDTRFLTDSTNPNSALNVNTLQPWALSTDINPTALTGDIVHRYWHEQFQTFGAYQSNGTDTETGNNQSFITWSDNPGLVMSHFDATSLPEGLLAQQYTMCDNFYHSAFGGSFLNHQFLVTAAAPVYDNMPTTNNGNIAYLDAGGYLVLNTSGPSQGKQVQDGSITPVVGDNLTVTLNGTASTPVTITSSNVQAYASTAGTVFGRHYVVNTTRSKNLSNGTESNALVSLLPSLNDSNPGDGTRTYAPTIGDLLSMANVSWKWYSGGWAQIAGYSTAYSAAGATTNPLYPKITDGQYASNNAANQYQYHHQPFAYYDNYAPFGAVTVPAAYVGGFAGILPSGVNPGDHGITINQATNSAAHLQDETNFFADVASGNLPSVCFIKPVGINNEHPGYAALQTGQAHVASIVQAVQANPTLWAHTAIIITYDEHGGRWDHVTPPARDIWGPGVRVPCIVISLLAKQGNVDSTQRDTSSILSTIEQRFGLSSLNVRDANATTFANVFTSLQITRGGLVYDRRTLRYSQQVMLTNVSTVPVAGPQNLVLDNLSTNTTLTNAAGITANNAPLNNPFVTTAGNLAPGASVTVTLQFTKPVSGGITYSARVVSGTANP